MTWLQTIFDKLLAKMPDLRGADFKLAFYLVSRVVAERKAEVLVSQRALALETGLSRSNIQISLVRLEASGLFLREHGKRNQQDRYLLPAFRPPDYGPVLGPPVDLESGHPVPEIGPPVDLESGHPVPEIGPHLARKQVHPGPETGPAEPELPPAHNMERARAPVESSSFVGSSSYSIDSILLTRTLRENQRDEAEVLRRYMRSFIGRVADPTLDGKEIDDALVAQCLAIAPAGRLIECLTELRSRHVRPFQTMGWFVTAFLQHFMGVPPIQVKARRGALRVVRKAVNGETRDAEFTSELTSQLVSSAKGLG